MAKKQPISDDLCDFDSAGTYTDRGAKWQAIQARLFSVSNPYVGNKRGIITDIAHALEDKGVQYDSVLDLFGGSGVVSLFMKLLGKKVIYNDLLTSSYYNGLCFVENTSIRLPESDAAYFCKNVPVEIYKSFVQDKWGPYFTPSEAVFLDRYRKNVEILHRDYFEESMGQLESLPPADKAAFVRTIARHAEIYKALALLTVEHYVMENCFVGGRLNKGQVLAKLEHRLEHDRNQGHEMKFLLKPLPRFTEGSPDCMAFNLDADDLLDGNPTLQTDLLYLDPPYGSSQSDYAQMFRFCEEYIHGAPLEELPHIQAASKKFVQSKGYEEHFRGLLKKCDRFPTWAISYSEASFSDIDGITNILKDFRKDVVVVNIDHEYRYRSDRGSVTEYLIICRK